MRQISKERLEKIKAELAAAYIDKDKEEKSMVAAKELGDLSENEEYQTSRSKVESLIKRIGELQNIIDNSIAVEPDTSGKIGIGSHVLVQQFEDRDCTKPIGEPRNLVVEEEGDSVIQKILSTSSPLGKMIKGKQPGNFIINVKGEKYFKVDLASMEEDKVSESNSFSK